MQNLAVPLTKRPTELDDSSKTRFDRPGSLHCGSSLPRKKDLDVAVRCGSAAVACRSVAHVCGASCGVVQICYWGSSREPISTYDFLSFENLTCGTLPRLELLVREAGDQTVPGFCHSSVAILATGILQVAHMVDTNAPGDPATIESLWQTFVVGDHLAALAI